MSLNSDDDTAGTIYESGENVNEFEIGDRVAAFHLMFTNSSPQVESSPAYLAPVLTTIQRFQRLYEWYICM